MRSGSCRLEARPYVKRLHFRQPPPKIGIWITVQIRKLEMTINTIITVIADPGESEIVGAALQRGALHGRSDPGCLGYDLFRDTSDDHQFLIKKSFENQSALDAHISTKRYHDLVASIADICHIKDYLEIVV